MSMNRDGPAGEQDDRGAGQARRQVVHLMRLARPRRPAQERAARLARCWPRAERFRDHSATLHRALDLVPGRGGRGPARREVSVDSPLDVHVLPLRDRSVTGTIATSALSPGSRWRGKSSPGQGPDDRTA